MPGHLVGRQHRKHRLRRQHARKARHHLLAERRADAAGLRRIGLQPAIVEHHVSNSGRAEIEQRRRIARDQLFGRIVRVGAGGRADPDAAIAQPQRQPVAGAKARVMAGRTGDRAIARQDRVVEQMPAQPHLIHVGFGKHRIGLRQRPGESRRAEQEQGQKPPHAAAAISTVVVWR
jgi:hypothetical protein